VAQQASAVVICTTPSASLRPGISSLRVRLNSRLGAVARGALLAAALAASPLHAQSNNVRITKLSDVAFGAIGNVGADATNSQSLCIYANTAIQGYRITASGSAPGGAFSLTSGSFLLNYEVQWNQAPSQSSGTQLSPNVTLTGLISSATQQTCNSGPATSASLILVLRSSELSNARAGSYSGTLTLLVGPE
jgi:hypothetical protein